MQNNICNPDHTVKYAFDEPCFSQIRVYSTQIRARICWSGIVNNRRDHNLALGERSRLRRRRHQPVDRVSRGAKDRKDFD